MSAPRRVQRTRRAGQRGIPTGAVYVGRPTRWGNPFRVLGEPQLSVDLFRDWVQTGAVPADWESGALDDRRTKLLARLPELTGKDLACWCKTSEPCHADALLEILAAARAEGGA